MLEINQRQNIIFRNKMIKTLKNLEILEKN